MSFLPEVALSEDFQPFARFHQDFGFIPNLLRAQSLLPRVIEAQAAFEKAVSASSKLPEEMDPAATRGVLRAYLESLWRGPQGQRP